MALRILHFSDTHEPAVPEAASFFDKRILGCCNSRLVRAGRYDRSRLAHAVSRILEEKPDLIVFTGDAVSTSAPPEFDRAMTLFRPLIEAKIPVIATPGNHDCYVKNARCRAAMENFYRLLNGLDAYSEAPRLILRGGIRFSAIHCAVPTPWIMSSGKMNAETRDFLIAEAEKDVPEPLVCIGHFPLDPEGSLSGFRRKLYGAGKIRDLLRSGRIRLSLCGHVHRGYEKTEGENGGRELCSGSLTRYGRMNDIRFQDGVFETARIQIS